MAVAVPVRRPLGLGQQSGERARQRVDLMGGEDGPVGEVGLLLGEQPFEPEQEREAAPPLDRGLLGARVDLAQRRVECTTACRTRREGVLERLAFIYEALTREQLGTRNRSWTRKRGGITHAGWKVGLSEPRQNV